MIVMHESELLRVSVNAFGEDAAMLEVKAPLQKVLRHCDKAGGVKSLREVAAFYAALSAECLTSAELLDAWTPSEINQ